MKRQRFLLATAAICLSLGLRANTPVEISDVKIDDGFWNVRLERYKAVTLPYCMSKLQLGKDDLHLFDKTGEEGNEARKQISESDVYKVIEGAAYSLATNPDPALEDKMDGWISKIAAMQDDNGYINVAGDRMKYPAYRWKLMDNHEMYCAGHLIEAAVAYHQATGKDELLNVARGMADHMMSLFGPDKRIWVPGHPEVELALCRLAEETGERKYAEFAQWLINERGHNLVPEWDKEFHIDVVPCAQLKDAVGHAVRALFLFCGMSDVQKVMGHRNYASALNNMWDDITNRHMYITGGIGASAANEGFGPDYDLPNKEAYCESCASMSMLFWSKRMYAQNPDGKYLDVLERALYNGVLGGISLSGNKFNYVNPLETDGTHHRQPWHNVSCCPNQFARVLPSLGGYIYSTSPGTIWVNLFIGSTATMPDGDWKVKQTGGYPYAGNVEISVTGPAGQTRDLRVHIPGWCKNYTVKVNGSAASPSVEKGFAVFKACKSGDKISLNLDMPIELNRAHERVLADKGKIALSRGPLVYCVEECDNLNTYGAGLPDGRTTFSVLAADATLDGAIPVQAEYPGGKLKFVPYYAWDNRNEGKMMVWVDYYNAQTLKEDIDKLYIVGDLSSWTPREMVKSTDNLYYYEGAFTGGDGINSGRFRACTDGSSDWSWSNRLQATSMRKLLDPQTDPEADIVVGGYMMKDANWYIKRTGKQNYRVIFDLAAGRVSVTQDLDTPMPALAPQLYALGPATPVDASKQGNYWGWDPKTGMKMRHDLNSPYAYTYQFYLKEGLFRFMFENDRDWQCNQVHPLQEVAFGADGLSDCPISVYFESDRGDHNFRCTKAGFYRMTIDLYHMRAHAEYLGDSHPDTPYWVNNVYMIGDNTGWNYLELEPMDDPYAFKTHVQLTKGNKFHFAAYPEWGYHFMPEVDTEVTRAAEGIYPSTLSNGDSWWIAGESGDYELVFDLFNHRLLINAVSGVQGVEVSDTEAAGPVEYFNLQGMPVSHPAAGQVVIRRQGAEATKILVK